MRFLCTLLSVFNAGEQLFDNNNGQDFTYPTAAGISWEEWQAAALERQAEVEKERQKAEEVCVGVVFRGGGNFNEPGWKHVL
jgi:hypothetical protein